MIQKTFKWLAALLGVLIILLFAAGITYRPETSIPPGWEGRLVDVGDLKLRVLQKGSGPDVLLIHGCPGSVEDWSQLIDILAKDHRVTAYDRPGHGFSTGKSLPYTISANAETALQLIRILGLRNVVVVGHSYGSMTALAMAAQHPVEVRSYVVVGPAPYGITEFDPLYRLLALPYLGPGITRLVAPLVAEKKIRAGILQSFGPNANEIPQGFLEQRVKLWSRPGVGRARANEVLNFNADVAALAPNYGKISARVMIVAGDQEKNAAAAKRLQGEIPNSTLVEFPNTGHYVPVVRTAELADLVSATELADLLLLRKTGNGDNDK